jgi:benzoate membrane transport protein
MITLGLGATVATAFVALSPPVLIEGVAGLALLGALASAVTAAVADSDRREAAVVTFIVTASGITLGGIGAAFWGLIAGGLMMLLLRRTPVPPPPGSTLAPVPELAPGSVAEPVSGSVPELAPGSVAEPVSGSVPEPVSNSVPELAPGSVPEPVSASVAEPGVGSVPA